MIYRQEAAAERETLSQIIARVASQKSSGIGEMLNKKAYSTIDLSARRSAQIGII